MDNEDVLYNILLQLSINDIYDLCKSNSKYNHICHNILSNRQFWLDKYVNDLNPLNLTTNVIQALDNKIDHFFHNINGEIFITQDVDVKSIPYLPRKFVYDLNEKDIDFSIENEPIINFNVHTYMGKLDYIDIILTYNLQGSRLLHETTVKSTMHEVKQLLIYLKNKYGHISLEKNQKIVITL